MPRMEKTKESLMARQTQMQRGSHQEKVPVKLTKNKSSRTKRREPFKSRLVHFK